MPFPAILIRCNDRVLAQCHNCLPMDYLLRGNNKDIVTNINGKEARRCDHLVRQSDYVPEIKACKRRYEWSPNHYESLVISHGRSV